SRSFPDKLRPESQIWIEDGSGPRQLTRAATSNSSPRWSPDGRLLAFVSTRDGKPGIFTINPDGGEAELRHAHPTQPGELAWSPDGSQIAFVALHDPANPENEPQSPESPPPVRVVTRIDYKQENRGFLNDARNAIWILDLATNEARRITDDRTDHLAPVWSPDGMRVATRVTRTNGMTSQLAVTDVATGERVAVIGPEDGSVGTWTFGRDGTSIFYSGEEAKQWQADWFRYDFQSNASTAITTDLAVSVDSGFPTVALPSHPVWASDNELIYHASASGQSGLYSVDVETGETACRFDWPAMHGGFSVDAEARALVQSRATPGTFGEIVRIDLETGAETVIDSPNRDVFPPAAQPTLERITLNRAGFDIEGWLLFPAGFDESKSWPMVLDIHGGPNSHYGPGFTITQQALAGAGYIVLFTNPRGSTSYGREYTQGVIGDWAGEDYNDQMALVDLALERTYIDKARLGVYGYSYGGFMTSWIVGHTDRFAAAVIGAPLVDQTSFYGTADIGHTFTVVQVGGKPWEIPDEYRKRSPITYLHQATTPSLIVHGEQDDRVPIGQGEQAFMTLKRAGCEVEFVRYPGQAHAMLRTGPAAYRHDYLTRIVAWFDKHLGGGG
ncbi:MAG: S9 family peptidase, partial [Chloroflexota bacterium]|nr:S9 family peptidase [Chloroflexota bacterium]